MKSVCIDCGHGGKDSGAVGHELSEEDYNLIIGSLISAQLRESGISTFQTRAFDKHLSPVKQIDLAMRCELANKNKCDLFVSIHANAAESDKAEGFEIFYSSEAGRIYAQAVLASFMSFFPEQKVRGVKMTKELFVLKHTNMSAILIEGGFITNSKEAVYLKDEKKQVLFATAVTKGLLSVLNKE